MTMHAALRGAAYARILIEPNGTRRLVPMNPDRIKAQLTSDYRLVYEYWDNAQRVSLIQGEVLRLPYLVREGVDPISPVRLHAETIGMALASSRYTNAFLKNGGRPPGYVKLDVPFKDPEQRKKFKERLQSEIGGRSQGSTLLLEQGDYKAIGISNADAQLLDICKMTLLDICRIYRVPPHMAGDLDRATWSNVEQQSIDFVVHTIGPWLVRWEQALSRDLLTDDEQQEYYFEFNVDGLLRGDIKTRYGAYAQGRQWGWLSINDVRARENMNKIENGDDYLSPTNMIPAWQVGEQPENDDGPGKTPPTV
jgi:HK97 family phage portal protein